MAGAALCPRCGKGVLPEARACGACGVVLPPIVDATAKSPAHVSGRASGRMVVRTAKVADASFAETAPDDTMMEEEKPSPPPRRPVGPQPTAGRPSSANVRATGEQGAPGASGGKDSLIGRKLQEYVIEARLGVGGMGVVYRATHQLIGKAVAVKVLRADVVQEPRDMDRLLDEARVVAGIKHRGIINIFGAGTLDDGRHYLIMELLEGEALEQKMARDGKIPAGDAVIILEQVLAALTAAHEAGIVHRDLKPANVFLVHEGAQTYVKLLDFGLARRKQQDMTRIAGTPDYISPEHARGRPAGPPADLYAFGVLCFHMLTGRLPFIGTTPMEVMEQHVHAAPPVPHDVNPEIPKALSALILRLLAKEPGERPDAKAVKADMRAATKHLRQSATMMSLMAVEAAPSAPGDSQREAQRARELARDARVAGLRHFFTRRWPVVLGGLIGLWLLAVLAYVLWPAAEAPGPRKGARPGEATVVGRPRPGGGSAPGEAPSTPVDAARLAALRGERRVDERLEEVAANARRDKKLWLMFEARLAEARRACDAARTLEQFDACEAEVTDLHNAYLKMR